MVTTFTKSSEPNGWMGNMCGFYEEKPLNISYKGMKLQSSENLFQILRFKEGSAIVRQIAKVSGYKGKTIAKQQKDKMIVEQQSVQDVINMVYVVSLKLQQHPFLYEKLKETKGKIIEDVSSRRGGSGLFWGAALVGFRWIGYNILGSIYTVLRELDKLPDFDKSIVIGTMIIKILDEKNSNR